MYGGSIVPTVILVKVGLLVVVKACPVLKASCVSPIQSAVTATSSAFAVIHVPAPTVIVVSASAPGSTSFSPPVNPEPATISLFVVNVIVTSLSAPGKTSSAPPLNPVPLATISFNKVKLISGVVPPLETIGADPVTLVTALVTKP